MAKIITVFNQKGGSSKTTSTLNIASALSKKGKVLILDNDGQANATFIALGLDDDELEKRNIKTIHELLTNKKIEAKDVIIQSKIKNVDIIPASIDHIYSDMKLIYMMDNIRILPKKLKRIESNYDFIIIDNSPSIGLSTYNSLMVADIVVAPVETSVFSAKGLNNLINLLKDINENRENLLKLVVFLAKVDNRKKIKNIKIKRVLEDKLGKFFIKDNYISMNTAYIDPFEDGKTIDLWKESNVKQEYEILTEDILNYLK